MAKRSSRRPTTAFANNTGYELLTTLLFILTLNPVILLPAGGEVGREVIDTAAEWEAQVLQFILLLHCGSEMQPGQFSVAIFVCDVRLLFVCVCVCVCARVYVCYLKDIEKSHIKHLHTQRILINIFA